MNLKGIIREIEDFPKSGINFKDITTLLKDKNAFGFVVEEMYANFKNFGITKVVGLESRGFIAGGALAYKLGAGFVPVRKKGKLPATKIWESYSLEYGMDSIEMHDDALSPEDVVLIHDDLLATGGTAHAALRMVKRKEVKRIYFSFICDLGFIHTPSKDEIKEYHPQILVTY